MQHRSAWLAIGILTAAGCAHGDAAHRSAALTVANHSDLAICDVYLWKTRLGWGRTHLGPDERIAPGEEHTIALPAGRWNVQLDDCQRRTLHVRRELLLRGHRRLTFRTVEVQRRPGRQHRRFARAGDRARL